jgi:hypothetical protein
MDGKPGVAALLALLALMIGLVSPPGFMVAARGKTPTIVICTGHGPEAIAGNAGSPDQPHGKGRHDGACPFAGHGVGAAPTFADVSVRLAFPPLAAEGPRVRDLAPGRGLAAPPPQSHAPPRLV